MRVFSIIVAGLALIAGVTFISIVSKFRAMYEDLDAALPELAISFLNTSGWFLGGIFILAAFLLIALVITKKAKIAGGAAIFTLVILVGTAAVFPVVLMAPLSKVIREVEATQNKPTEQDGSNQPATAPESKTEGKQKLKPESEGRSQ